MRCDIFSPDAMMWWCGRWCEMQIGKHKISFKLNYKEVYKELVNQNEIPIKMTATKEDLKNSKANFDRKMSNVLLKQL